MRISLLAIALLLAGCRPADEPEPAFQPSKTTIASNPYKNIEYGKDTGPHHALDLYLPKDKKGEPLLIFIHGGAWIGGDKALYTTLGKRFQDDGIAVATVNYRLSPSVKHPEHVKDTAQAYAWLVKNADKYGYDPRKIFVSGHSAGAHNAGMMATGSYLADAKVPTADMPAGFIGFEGIYDIPDLNAKFPSYKDWFFEKAFGETSAWAEASPSRRKVVIHAPWLIAQSTTDPLVNVPQADKFAAHLQASNVKVELWKKDMGNHDEVVQNLSGPKNDLAAGMIKFIKSH